MPFIPSHAVIVFVVCLLFLAEAHIVYHVDGFWIYPFLDTTSGPIWMAMYVGVGFAILCAFFLMYFLHRGRNWIRTKRAHRHFGSSQQHQQQINGTRVGAGEERRESAINSLATSSADDMESYEAKEANEPGSYSYYINGGAMAVDHQMLDIQTQNRKRSCSNCSEDSTTSTLVGADEGIRAKRAAARKQSFVADTAPISPGTEQQLEKVEEMNENEGDNDEGDEHHP
ncbi:hypothetical protein BGZ58_003063 [Dissophora ornata]|nr:hypothetical protein BGZ58_003063 [Dissophora ornata]